MQSFSRAPSGARWAPNMCVCYLPVPTWVDAFGSLLRIDGAEVAILKRNVSF